MRGFRADGLRATAGLLYRRCNQPEGWGKQNRIIAKSRAGRPACFLRAELAGMALYMLYSGVELDIAALAWVTKTRSGLLRALYLIYMGNVLSPRAS